MGIRKLMYSSNILKGNIMSINKLTGVLEHPHQETSIEVISNVSKDYSNINIAVNTSEAVEFEQLNVFAKGEGVTDIFLPISPTNKNIPKQIQVMPVIIDKIVITIDIPVQDRKMIIERMKDESAYRGGSPRYNNLLTLPLSEVCLPYLNADKTGDTCLRIEADPRNPTYNFMRFEWNPAKVDVFQIVSAIEHFIPPLWKYEDILTKAKITRLDITIDLLNIRIDKLLFYSIQKLKTAVWNNSSSKGGRTLYLGGNRSQKCFCIYDKAALIQLKNAQKVPELKEDVSTEAITRIELVLRPNTTMTLLDIPKMKNPFLDLKVYGYPVGPSFEDDLFVQTIARARYEGISKALRALSLSNRKKYLVMMKAYEKGWWDPADIWKQMPNVVDSLIHPY